MTVARNSAGSLAALFRPRSVVVIGASDDPTRIGGRPLRYLLDAKFAGPIFAVNPNRDMVQGVPAHRSVEALPEGVDLAVVAVPAAAVVDAVAACGERGIPAAVVLSSGFAEMGEEGRDRQAELRRTAAQFGIRLLGPNCLGMINPAHRLFATFTTVIENWDDVPSGRIGFVSQSGALASYCLAAARELGTGFSSWVTTGNECDLEVADCIDYFVDDPHTAVIAVYLEGVRNGAKLTAALERARRARKPVVALKVGRSDRGAAAVASHTAALVGDDVVFDAVFDRYGVHRARTIAELLEVALACAVLPTPPNNRTAIVTVSGGVGILQADAAEGFGLDVAPTPVQLQAELKSLVPLAAVVNPVDTTGQIVNDPLLAGQFLAKLLAAGYGSATVFLNHLGLSDEWTEIMLGPLAQARQVAPDCPIVICAIANPRNRDRYRQAGFHVVGDPTTAMLVLGALSRFANHFERIASPAGSVQITAPPVPDGVGGEVAAKHVLAAIGIEIPRERVVFDEAAAAAAAVEIGMPVVLKVASPTIAHKTEIGGVRLDIRTGSDVRAAFADLIVAAQSARPGAQEHGVLVSPMVTGGVELLVGFRRDPVFGPVMLLGLGGVAAEAIADVVIALPPLSTGDVDQLIDRLRGRDLIRRPRNGRTLAVDALRDAVVRLSELAGQWGDAVDSFEVNPLLLTEDGVVALDALIVSRSDAATDCPPDRESR